MKGLLKLVLFIVALSLLTILIEENQRVSIVIFSLSALLFEILAIYLMRKRSSAKVDQLKEIEGDYHNDFSKVPSGGEIDVKPIDLTGNVFEHNNETLKEDLEKIGIKPISKTETKSTLKD